MGLTWWRATDKTEILEHGTQLIQFKLPRCVKSICSWAGVWCLRSGSVPASHMLEQCKGFRYIKTLSYQVQATEMSRLLWLWEAIASLSRKVVWSSVSEPGLWSKNVFQWSSNCTVPLMSRGIQPPHM